ncbi:hypothetical protein BZA70DRAFT_281278 [Myxozyma melibiosi]|uniref:LDB19 N-terminal domain-containing protein n=1 Tax=Myxozyma melibiosi TaxID=54550 RepID=A0ABR1F2D5_9ASCO
MPSIRAPPSYSPVLLPAKPEPRRGSSPARAVVSAAKTAPAPLPPLICYGTREQSTGALLSGLLFLYVNAYAVPMSSVTLELVQEISFKRPVSPSCKSCIKQTNVLKRWDLLSHDTTLPRSEYGYPFSHLLPGDMPASTASALVGISYHLRAVAVPLAKDLRPITLVRSISVFRSVPSTDIRRCLRVFPPTLLNVTASLPAICFPKSELNLTLQVNNLVNREKRTRWTLRKLNWVLNETAKTKQSVCKNHMSSTTPLDDVRGISSGEIRRGWKTDFSNDGQIELEVPVSTFADEVSLPVACNVAVPDIGFSVEHLLVVEMLVSEEHLPATGQHATTPTGAARILRMQFAVDLTERGGLGISWDDEVPPTYDDVPISPPGYDYIDTNQDVEHMVM